ncbi:MAG: 6-phosphogluconolactonase [Gammaproteobacteria bacterium]|nr:6-phosphogluconolactonase [Gammaproteobacteria bacterium]
MSNLAKVRWHISDDSVALAREASEKILHEARLAIGRKGSFNIVFAGGNTPLHAYRHLVRGDTDWGNWQVYFGDERCVERSDPMRNDLQIQEVLFDDVSIPAVQIHHMLADAGFEVAISDYEKKIRHAMPFDLVILGIGEDGHTASLFPGQEHDPNQDVVAVRNAPKEPAERISLNYAALNNARKVMFIVEGEHKRSAVESWLAGNDLPASRVSGIDGTDVYLDRASWPD